MKCKKVTCWQFSLTIILNQFLQHIYLDFPQVCTQDSYTHSIYVNGIKKQDDHRSSLIQQERIFYYCCAWKIYIIRQSLFVLIKRSIIWLYQKLKSFTTKALNLPIIITMIFDVLVSFLKGMLL